MAVNTLLRRSVEFTIYTANESDCDHLLSSITKRCQLSSLEVHNSLHSEKTVERRVEITSDQIMSTSMFNQIRSQVPRTDMVAPNGGDFKWLISETTDRVTVKNAHTRRFRQSVTGSDCGLDKLLEQKL